MCDLCCECHIKDSLTNTHHNFICCNRQNQKYLQEDSFGDITIEYIIYHSHKEQYFLTYSVDKSVLRESNENNN